jgi:hypothetical protein
VASEPFRRLLIDRPRNRVVVETGRGIFHSLPGNYNPDAMLPKIKTAGRVDLSKWEPWDSGQ